VRETHEAISWLSGALVELDESSTEVPGTLVEVFARLLIGWVFAAVAHDGSASA